MFKLNPNPTFKARVEISTPGSATPASIEIEWKHLSRTGIKRFFEGLTDKTDAEALGQIIVGWSGIDAEYCPENLALLLDNYPAASVELFDAYRRELMEARRKN